MSDEKKEKIAEYYNENAGNVVSEYRPFEKIFDPKWLNKSVHLDTIYARLDEIITETIQDIEMIYDLKSSHTAALLLKYKEGASLREIITYNVKLNKENSRIAEETYTSQASTPQQTQTPSQAQNSAQTPEENEEVKVIDFRVYVTNSQLSALKAFLIDNKIKYGKVPKNTEV